MPNSNQKMFTAGQPRVDQIGEKLGKLNLEKPCKDMCKRIRGTSRSKIPRTQKIEGPIKIRSGGKRRFGRMCKKTCMTKAKEKIRRSISKMKRLEKERKKCKQILSRRHTQGRKGQRSKAKRHGQKKERERKWRTKSKRQGRLGFGSFAFSSSFGYPLIGLGLIPGLSFGLGTGLNLGLRTGFKINICFKFSFLDLYLGLTSWSTSWGTPVSPLGKALVEAEVESRKLQNEVFKQEIMKALGVNAGNVPLPGPSESLNIGIPNPKSDPYSGNIPGTNMGMDPNVAPDQMESARSPRTGVLKNPRVQNGPRTVNGSSLRRSRSKMDISRKVRASSVSKVHEPKETVKKKERQGE